MVKIDDLTKAESQLHSPGIQSASTNSKLSLEPQTRPARLPLSFAQQGLWFIDKLNGTSSEYNMPFGLRFRGELDQSALERALNTMIERHESLRTHFEEIDGEPAQIVEREARISLPVEDLRGVDEAKRLDCVMEALKQEGKDPFDLSRGPLLRAKLLKLGERDHVCLQTMHHIISDGWSWNIFHQELMTLYEAYRQGLENPLKPLTAQYADYALWQRKRVESGALDESIKYWKKQLEGIPERLELPVDRSPHSRQEYRAEVFEMTLPPRRTMALRQLSRENQATLYMSLLAAFSLLLSRYSGQDDIVVGSPIANRQNKQQESMMGFLVNRLVMRNHINPEMSFKQLLHEVKRTTLEAYQHQDVPFDRVAAELSSHGRRTKKPLTQITLVLQNMPWGVESLETSLEIEPLIGDAAQARFDLEVHIWETQGRLRLRWLYRSDLFELWRIRQMARHYTAILEEIVTDSEKPLRCIELLDREEQQKILIEWNETAEEAPDGTLIDLFHQQCEKTPDAVAVVERERQLTFRELDKRANQLAHFLRKQGVQTEDIVAVAQSRSLEMVIALVGILKAGGACLPLDMSYPADRLALMLADASVKIVLCDRDLSSVLKENKSAIVTVNHASDAFAEELTHTPIQIADSRNVAYVIYTSGSTGRPKGVAIEHGNLTSFLLWAEKIFGPLERAEVLMATSLSFDVSIFELFFPLCKGGKIVLAQNILDLVHEARTNQPTMICTVPPAMAEILGMGAIPESVRVINLGGQPLSSALVDAVYKRTNAKVMDLYGPCETTVYSTFGAREKGGPETIGKPILNTQIYVLDSNMQPAPIGVIGELFIAGLGVARCYLNRSESTAERFVANPWGEPGSRMYKTGDLVRWRFDGSLEYIGRADDQVKIRGFRIEPGEIEATLRRHSKVQDAAVILRDDTQERTLVGYVTRAETAAERDEARASQIDQWRQIYDSVYEQTDQTSGDFNLAGWTNSYTGQPIAPDEMRQWVQGAVTLLKELRAAQVVEIGCGTGLLLNRLAGDCETYIGLDFSRVVLDRLATYLSGRDDLRSVELRQGLAHDLSFLADASVDLVIVNSVVQYFPDVQYLLNVMEEAVRVTRRGGHIFVGDLRSLPLLEAYHTSVQLSKTAAGASHADIRQRIGQAMRDEEELLVDGRFFEELGRRWANVGRVKLLLKAGAFDNELSRFRYDALIRVGGREEVLEPDRWIAWNQDGRWRTEVEKTLLEAPTSSIGVRDLPDRRAAQVIKTVQLLANETAGCAAEKAKTVSGDAAGEDPDAVLALSRELGVELVWRGFGADGVYDAVFNPHWVKVERLGRAPAAYYGQFANTPSKNSSGVEFVQELKTYLRQKLPDYMVPPAIIVMPSLPLMPNRKLDRRRLPMPEFSESGESYRAPRTPEEELLCGIFARVLGVERVGVDDDFFELGGHSLMATRLSSRIRPSLGADVSVRTIFESSSVRALATRLREARNVRPILERQVPPTHLPLSYAQQRLWFIDKLNGASSVYNLQVGVRLKGELDELAFERALNTILERHESMRTHFEEIGDEPVQVIGRDVRMDLPVEDLRGLDEQAKYDRVMDELKRERAEPFDLSKGPLMRVKLLKLDDREHAVVRTMHHIMTDGWSEDIFNRELGELYEAYRQGRENPLKPLKAQHADFTLWQRRWLEGGGLEKGTAYWNKQLQNIPERLELPTDRPYHAVQSFRGEVIQVILPAHQVTALKQLSRDNQATMYMIMLAAYAVLLSRYSGQDDMVIATPVANREDTESEKMIGFFINILLMRILVRREFSFRELLNEVRNTTLTAYQHQDVPFERLVREIAPLRSMNATPLHHIVFSLLTEPPAVLKLAGLEVDRIETGGLRLPVDLGLDAVAQDDGGVRLCWIYNSELFDHWRIKQMARHYGRILQAMLEDINQTVGLCPLLGPEERERILVDWNHAPCDAPTSTVLDLFESQVRQRPEAIAVICDDVNLTYRALDERSNRLASLLKSRGAGPEQLAAVLMPRSLEFVTALLAITKAGAAYLPLDPETPQQRLSVILEDSKPACVLTTSKLSAPLFSQPPQIVIDDPKTIEALDGHADVLEKAKTVQANDPEHISYVIYTSGSTGKPKGVAVPQRALVNKIFSFIKYLHISPSTRYAVVISPGFDPILEEIWNPLCGGGVAVILPIEIRRHLDTFADSLDRYAPTVLPMSPALTEYWSRHGRIRPDLLVIGGDVLETALANRLYSNRLAARIFNVYGPTETCIEASWYEIQGELMTASTPIGRSAPNYELYVLDENLEPVAIGVAGELYIAGAGLARGYLNQPAFTAERFIANPFRNDGARMFRTGDLAKWGIDGDLEFIGRIDNQVKIRGYRIELGDVEAALREYPGVREAAATVREDTPGEKQLAGYVVWDDAVGDLEGMRNHLKTHLPKYMVPSALLTLKSLPLTPNGKVDRKALPAPRFTAAEEYRPPRTKQEERLCQLFAEVLKQERVGIDDDFFALGGHSLLATQLINRIQETLDVEFSIAALFEAPRIVQLSDRLIGSGQRRPALRPRKRSGDD